MDSSMCKSIRSSLPPEMELLMEASQTGNIGASSDAIRQNPNVLAQVDEIPFVDTALHVAATAGHIEFAVGMIRLKPSFAWKLNPDGLSPVHLALQMGHSKMVLWLVDFDSQLNRIKGREGLTPLHYVIMTPNRDTFKLLSRFLSVCPQSIQDVTIRNEILLHIALKDDCVEAFEFPVDRLHWNRPEEDRHWEKAIFDLKDIEGNTVLHAEIKPRQA